MKDKTKILLLKILLVVGSVLGILFVLGSILVSLIFMNHPMVDTITYYWFRITFFSTVGVGILFIILSSVFKIKQKPVKAERIYVEYNNYDEVKAYILTAMEKEEYKAHDSICFDESSSITMFTKSAYSLLKCFALIRVPELTEENFEVINDKITEFMYGYYGTENITDKVSMISMFCIDRLTNPFTKLVNGNIEQGFKNYRLPCGISFGGKTLYIARQEDGFAIMQYKKLRKELYRIMGLDPKRSKKSNSKPS